MDQWLMEIEQLGERGEISITKIDSQTMLPDQERVWEVTLTVQENDTDNFRNADVGSEARLRAESDSLEAALRAVRRMANDLGFKS